MLQGENWRLAKMNRFLDIVRDGIEKQDKNLEEKFTRVMEVCMLVALFVTATIAVAPLV